MLFNRDNRLYVFEPTLPGYTRSPPQILQANAIDSESVFLTWSETPGATSYGILRSTGKSTPELLAENLSTATYLDTTVQENHVYGYQAFALLENAERIESSVVLIRPNPAPELLSLTHLGPGQIALTFNEPMGRSTEDADAYSIDAGIGKATSAIKDRQGYRVALTFDVEFPPNETLTLSISSVSDTSGVPLPSRFNLTHFTSIRPTYPTSGIADFNRDGEVSFSDFILFVQAYGSTDARFDLDTNGQVDFADFIIFANLYGK
jgi:hypothetical protein